MGFKICIVTRKSAPRGEMLRFVISPERELVFDVSEKLPGAGLWVSPQEDGLKKAIAKNAFAKAWGKSVRIPSDFENLVANVLRARTLDLLGFARKGGSLVFGYEAVKKALENGTVAVAFEAADSSERGRNKLYRPDDEFPIYSFLTREELGQITGQDVQVHVAVLKGKIASVLQQTAFKFDLLSQ